MTTTHASGHGALFRPYQMGSLLLPNRIVMAPLTRSRADGEGVPSPLAPEYYAQRSSAGLIIAEGTAVSRQGTGYLGGPGLYTDAQVAGWRPVTDAVHRAGGRSIAPSRRGRPDRGAWRPASPERKRTMGLSWQQGPLAPGAIGRFLVPDPLPDRLLFAEPLRRRMRVRFGGAWIADSEDVVLLHEPGRYPVAYFPLSDITSGVLQPSEYTTRHRDLGLTSWYTVRSGEHSKQRAAWQHTRLPDYASELKGRVAFAWRTMDAFYEEDERIVGHAADSYHRIDIRQTSRRLVVRCDDQVIADTTRPLVLYESGFAPRWYVPRADVDESALAPAEGQTFCPYKGLCSYYDIAGTRRAAWSYQDAWREVRRISGLISFEPDKVAVHLDGTRLRLEPGQTVIPHGADRDLTTGEAAPGRQP